MSKLIISSHVSEDRRQRTLTRAELPFIFILAIEMTQMSQWEGFILILKRILKSECCCIEIGDECIDFKMISFVLDPEQSVLAMLGKDYGSKSLQGPYKSI